MPFRDRWLIPNSVILCDGEGQITLDEVMLANQEITAMMRAGYRVSQKKNSPAV